MRALDGIKIMVDLDDTLWDLTRPWVEVYNQKTGDDLAWEEISAYEIMNFTVKMTYQELTGLLTPEFYLAYVEPYPFVAGRLNRLRKDGAQLTFATLSPISGFKEQFLDRFGLLMPGDIFVEISTGDKNDLVKAADVVIDDRPATIIAAGIHKAIIPNKPWNSALNHPNWTRMSYWAFASVGFGASEAVSAVVESLKIPTVRSSRKGNYGFAEIEQKLL